MNKIGKSLHGQRPLWVTMLLALLAVFAIGCADFAEQLVEELETVVVESESGEATEQSAADDGSQSDSAGDAANAANDQGQEEEAAPQAEAEDDAADPPSGFAGVADYIRQYGTLPDNYLTKKEAQERGWVASEGNLHEVAPGMSIGGDRFGNREKLLPEAKGRVWYEADINYEGGRRNADRIVYSNDGLIYMTTDHYKSFTDITEKGSVPE